MYRPITQLSNANPIIPFEQNSSVLTARWDSSLGAEPTPALWPDLSGNSRDMTGVASPKPGHLLGRYPAVRFAIGDYYGRSGFFAAQPNCTVFAVMQAESTSGPSNIGGLISEATTTTEHGSRCGGETILIYSNTGPNISKSYRFGKPFLIAWSRTGTSVRCFLNGYFTGSGTMNNVSLGAMRIMRSAYSFDNRWTSGLFSNAVVYNVPFDDASVVAMSAQLMRKWRLRPGLVGVV